MIPVRRLGIAIPAGNSRHPIRAALAVLLLLSVQAQHGASQVVVGEEPLKKFLVEYLESDHIDLTARYSFARIDLNDDMRQEVVVYLSGQELCGSGGCTALILEPEASSFKVVTRITLARLPIRVLQSWTNGWHDIGVWVRGGGIQRGYTAILRFNGHAYPENPSVAPARRLSVAPGDFTLIPLSEGELLYGKQ